MRILCVENNGSSLSQSWNSIGYSSKSEFHLSVGKEYAVHGMAIWRDHLLVLLCDDVSLPNWYPIKIFYVSDGRMPSGWKFTCSRRQEDSLLQALWGYDELITVKGHYDGLLERDANALRIFFEQEN